MRLKLVSLCAVSALFAITGFASAGTVDVGGHTTANVHLREGPGVMHAPEGVVPEDTGVDVFKCGKKWCLVEAPGGQGYMSKRYIAIDGDPILPLLTPEEEAAVVVAAY